MIFKCCLRGSVSTARRGFPEITEKEGISPLCVGRLKVQTKLKGFWNNERYTARTFLIFLNINGNSRSHRSQ